MGCSSDKKVHIHRTLSDKGLLTGKPVIWSHIKCILLFVTITQMIYEKRSIHAARSKHAEHNRGDEPH